MGIASNQPPRAWWSGFRDHWLGFFVRKGAAGTIWPGGGEAQRGLSLYEGPDFGNIIKSSSNNRATHFNDAMEPVLFLHIKWPIPAYKSISDLCIAFTCAAFLGQHAVNNISHCCENSAIPQGAADALAAVYVGLCWTVTEQWTTCFQEVKESITGSHSEQVSESKQW